jgi:hypothetical protein
MDDSERSYGYSRDIYHGKRGAGGAIDRTSGGIGRAPFYPDEGRFERSYEYGRNEGMGDDTQGPDFSPEEAAIRIRGRADVGVGPDSNRRGKGRYDYGTAGPYAEVDSFTWDVPGPSAAAARAGTTAPTSASTRRSATASPPTATSTTPTSRSRSRPAR